MLSIFYSLISIHYKINCLLFSRGVTRKMLKITRKRVFFCGLRVAVCCHFLLFICGL
ncbi:putative membrane protein [Escherichia coli G58-1]|nr:putative membrane protein [Escherichia coli G58-1]